MLTLIIYKLKNQEKDKKETRNFKKCSLTSMCFLWLAPSCFEVGELYERNDSARLAISYRINPYLFKQFVVKRKSIDYINSYF